MSTVKEILGIQATPVVAAPIASLMSSMGMGTTTPSAKKRKSFTTGKASKLVASLHDSMNPIAIRTRPYRKWGWMEFENNGHSGRLRLRHWDHDPERKDYPGSRFNLAVDMPALTDLSDTDRERIITKFHLKDLSDLEGIFGVLARFELRFVVALDHINERRGSGSDLTIESLKDLYYSVYSIVFPSKKCRFSAESESERRECLEDRFRTVLAEGVDVVDSRKKEEKRLTMEIKELEQKLKSIESDQEQLASILFPEPTSKDTHGLINLYTKTCVPGAPKETKSVATPIATALKPRLNFSTCLVPAVCGKFNSPRIEAFLLELGQLAEQERALTTFIKRKETEIKSAQKILS
jgi:hypothetical protein